MNVAIRYGRLGQDGLCFIPPRSLSPMLSILLLMFVPGLWRFTASHDPPWLQLQFSPAPGVFDVRLMES